ncbi:MAG: UMP kinase [Hyphomicrobiaceae bacterium]
MSTATPRFRRLLLKLSGEALMGEGAGGIDMATVGRITREVKAARELGTDVAIVVGGGNIFRGLQGAAKGMERGTADYMGMLATVMNGLALGGALEAIGQPARVMSAIPMPTVCEPFVAERARRHLARGRVVVFTGGTGNPYFTTDTAAALRAAEMGCDGLAKATQVDGIYTADPKKDPTARRYEEVTYDEVLARDLKVMDGAAIALARENRIPIIVFSIREEGGLVRMLTGAARSTIVRQSA